MQSPDTALWEMKSASPRCMSIFLSSQTTESFPFATWLVWISEILPLRACCLRFAVNVLPCFLLSQLWQWNLKCMGNLANINISLTRIWERDNTAHWVLKQRPWLLNSISRSFVWDPSLLCCTCFPTLRLGLVWDEVTSASLVIRNLTSEIGCLTHQCFKTS